MKKTNIYLAIGAALFIFGSVLTPLSGKIFVSSVPNTGQQPIVADPLSRFMLTFSRPVVAEPLSLTNITHVEIKGAGANKHETHIEISKAPQPSLLYLSPYYLLEPNYQINGDTLTMQIDDTDPRRIKLLLDSNLHEISLKNMKARVTYASLPAGKDSSVQYTVSERADINFANLRGDDNREPRHLKLKIQQESKVKFNDINVASMSVQLNNSILDLSYCKHITSLTAHFEGLSHILGIKKRMGDFETLDLTGNLDYFRTR